MARAKAFAKRTPLSPKSIYSKPQSSRPKEWATNHMVAARLMGTGSAPCPLAAAKSGD